MEKNNLLKEAIADAKAVRDVALQNAREALQEAFAPQIEALVSEKIKEEMSNDEEDMDEAIAEYMGGDDEDDFDFETPELPAEDPRARKAAMKDIESEMTDEEEMEDEEINLDELISEMGDEESLDEYGDEHPISTKDALEDEDEDEEVNLDELLAEYEEESMDEEKDSMYEAKKEEKEENKKEAKGKKEAKDEAEEIEDMTMEELKDLIKSVVAEMGMEDMGDAETEGGEEAEELEEMRDELMEARKVIKHLKNTLNETNLMNAKLLYVNRLFRKFNLDESKKVKIVNKLDEANNAKEAKLIYESLNEVLSTKSPKKNINESVASFASKPTGNSTKGTEVDPIVARMQFLANVKVK